jgi:hypothetical protein
VYLGHGVHLQAGIQHAVRHLVRELVLKEGSSEPGRNIKSSKFKKSMSKSKEVNGERIKRENENARDQIS